MPFTHVVVDGSNLATEGRSIPSLAQLDEAVREFHNEFPQAEITVVVDATFGHRIDPSERQAFDEAQAHGELVSPPAGAIGRGDAFLLRIADRSGATVLSNDSFQEFHGEYDWLFTKDRLIGGKPVPGVGWIFTPRTPVRGPKSRESMREARRSRVRIGSKEASRPMPVPKAPPPRPGSGGASRTKADLSDAIAAATAEVVSPEAPPTGKRRRRSGGGPPPEAVNDPLTFISFIAEHPLGSEVEGEVDSFASHGCFVTVEGARCYLPLSAMGDPPPRSAREVLDRGVRRVFILQALDPQRRGIELALPGFAHVSGAPQQETVEAEIASSHIEPGGRGRGRGPEAPDAEVKGRKAGGKGSGDKQAKGKKPAGKKPEGKKSAGKKPAPVQPVEEARTGELPAPAPEGAAAPPQPVVPAKTTAAKKTAAKKAAPAKKAAAEQAVPAKKAAAKKVAAEQAAPAEQAPARKTAAKKVVAKKVVAKKVVAKKVAPAEQPAPAEQAPARKTAAKKAPAEKTAAKKTVAKKVAPAEQPAPAEQAPARKTAAKKAPAEKTATKKAAAKKAPAEKAPGEKRAAKRGAGGKAPGGVGGLSS